MSARWFHRGQFLGTGETLLTSEGRRWTNICFFCPTCGELWARAMNDSSVFTTFTAPCELHPQTDIRIPGSLLLPWSWKPLDGLPKEVLEREFILHYQNWKRHDHQSCT